MIVAIIDNTSPTGVVPVQQFLKATDEAAGVTEFINSLKPVGTAADWLGFDTGWTDYTRPSVDNNWEYDFGASALVQVKQAASDIQAKLDTAKTNVTAATTVASLRAAVLEIIDVIQDMID